MDSSVLVPPNCRQLSDDVIGNVLQRTRPVRHSRSAPKRRVAKAINEDDGWSPMTVKRRKHEQKPIDISSLKRLQAVTIAADKKQAPLTRAATASEEHPKVMELLRLSKAMERERRRVNQRKYRKKQEDLTASLETQTQHLREEIGHLEQQRCDIPAVCSVWDVACEYFRIMREPLQSRTQSSVGLRFLQRTMVPNVVFNTFQGSKMILSNWTSLQQLGDVEVELKALQKVANGSLEAITTTSFTLTERTLRTVFPHLCTDSTKELNSLSPLAMKLLDERFVVHGSTRFDWDKVSGRVNRVTSQSDFMTPMLCLVRSFELASRVFEKALVSPDFQWR